VIAAWVVFRSPNLTKAGAILSAMSYKLSAGASYRTGFYLYTLVVAAFCAMEPVLARTLRQIDEQAPAEGLSPLRVVGRPLAYLFGLLLFLLFDSNNAQFIYSQF